MSDVSGVDNLNSGSSGSDSLTGIKSAIDNLNAGKAESSAVVPNTRTVNGYPLSADVALAKSDLSLGNVDNTSDATKNAASVSLTNKTISDANNTVQIGGATVNGAGMASGQFLGYNGSQWVPVSSGSTLAQVLSALSAVTGVSPVYLNPSSILFDAKASLNAGASSLSASFTVGNNANRVLVAFVGVMGNSTTPTITSVTYNGVAMTALDANAGGSVINGGSFILTNPATGSNTLAVTTSGGDNIEVFVYSYYNCKQSGQPDNHGKSSVGTGVTSTTNALTTVNNGALVLGAAFNQNASSVAFTPTVGYGNNVTNVSGISNSIFTMSMVAGDNSYLVVPGGSTNTATCASASFAFTLQVSLIPFGTNGVAPASSATHALSDSFLGFSTAGIAAGSSGTVIINGVVTGLSGLVPGAQYYLNDTVATIGTSPGTVTRKIGIAISTTSLLLTNTW